MGSIPVLLFPGTKGVREFLPPFKKGENRDLKISDSYPQNGTHCFLRGTGLFPADSLNFNIVMYWQIGRFTQLDKGKAKEYNLSVKF